MRQAGRKRQRGRHTERLTDKLTKGKIPLTLFLQELTNPVGLRVFRESTVTYSAG